MMSKLFNYGSTGDGSSESTPIIPSSITSGDALDPKKLLDNAKSEAVIAGTHVVNESYKKIQRLQENSPFSFRVLAVVGGLAMIVSNILLILGRLLTFNFTGAIISFYCVVFGVIIVLLEAHVTTSYDDENSEQSYINGQRLQQNVRYYAKFLEFTWGRGLLYFFVGTLQLSNWNILDVAVGGFMMFVGVTACIAGVKSAYELRRLRETIKDEQELRDMFDKYDKDGNGHLGMQELTMFINEAGIPMSQNEITSAYMALNRKLDDKLSYEELVAWWTRPSSGPLNIRLSV